ncbi:MAG: TOBE domain-containing protein [Clostridium sp.]|jgi:molybdopterin-binding protein|uniref:TOBE domain-containing protein n=1 Tax=Clostridium sp. TaxID=1506 RepID=UPI0025C0B020|nr:TOBE domain-containing protein [Clostridium sp.]MCH3964777.1 TOBE domain-containing protein [Clostridium sp.]MCI1715248.1 TOBE domain-containing protein [Clostridium sp.]MCI1799510.1 TOBE domain-containing protein [Clostridium sp.]MCI1813431.1 TOBE domain-containing protein [Clostridium sp.]MCI1870322.1 TOBE domain-containing protein [Clostridium sp.]
MNISARNQLKGKIVDIKRGSVNGEVILDVGDGKQICSIITLDAINSLGLKVGSEATAVIKASNVMVMA